MVLLRTSYTCRYGGYLEYYFKLQFNAFWSIHSKTEKMLILRYILPPPKKKRMNHLQKNIYPIFKKKHNSL